MGEHVSRQRSMPFSGPQSKLDIMGQTTAAPSWIPRKGPLCIPIGPNGRADGCGLTASGRVRSPEREGAVRQPEGGDAWRRIPLVLEDAPLPPRRVARGGGDGASASRHRRCNPVGPGWVGAWAALSSGPRSGPRPDAPTMESIVCFFQTGRGRPIAGAQGRVRVRQEEPARTASGSVCHGRRGQRRILGSTAILQIS